jgi:long-chain acyl-CoA synthetase
VSRYYSPGNLLDGFLNTVEQQPDDIALSSEFETALPRLTWRAYADLVCSVAGGLSRLGIRGEHVVLSLPNCPEFHVADLAVLAAGGIPVSIYHSASDAQVAHVLRHSRAKLAIGFTGSHADRLRRAARNAGLQVTVAETGPAAGSMILGGLARGAAADLRRCAKEAEPGTPATVIYTSGTTGEAKGVRLSHRNVIAAFESTIPIVGRDGRGKKVVSYLPMAHIAERMSSHYNHLLYGSHVICCPAPGLVYDVVRRVHPAVFFGPPRIWEKLVLSLPPRDRSGAPLKAGRAGAGLAELELGVSGAAPMAAELLEVLRQAGLPLSEVYGMSETTGAMTWDAVEVRAGTVGRSLPGIEVRLGDRDEVQCRGEVVFGGYLHDEARTRQAFTPDGWLRTGDVGALDSDGYLCIVGRQKEILVTSGGKNVAPAPLEARLSRLPLVSQAMVVGDSRPFVAALLVLNEAAVAQHGRAADAGDHTIIAALADGIGQVNAQVSRAESVRRFAIVAAEWTAESGLLTPTLKLRRTEIAAELATVIEDLYAGGGYSVSSV